GFGQRDFLTPEFGERYILDDVVGEAGFFGGGGHVVVLLFGVSFRVMRKHRTMVRNCAPGNLEIPGSVLPDRPGMTEKKFRRSASAGRRDRSFPRRSRRPFRRRGRSDHRPRCGG